MYIYKIKFSINFYRKTCLYLYIISQDKDKINQAWSDTEILLDALYKEHSNSYLAPYFLVFKSQVILDRDHNL